VELFHIQAQMLETPQAVHLTQNAQHLAARQGAQIADPVGIRESDYVLFEYLDLDFENTQRVNSNTYRIPDLVSQH
jgi:hypothetical protein